MQQYKASLDKTTAGISIAFTILVLVLIVKSIQILLRNNWSSQDAPMYFFIILVLIVIWVTAFLRQIRHYELSDNQLLIKTRRNTHTILLKEVEKIEELNLLPFASLKNLARRALFAYRGRYHFPTLGYIDFYASQKKNLIYLQTKNKENIIISPDDIALLKDIKNKIN